MSFEQERIANEQAAALHARIAEILDGVDNPTPHQLVAAIAQAQEELDPNHGELVYEMDPNS
jgi:hypothetical protein